MIKAAGSKRTKEMMIANCHGNFPGSISRPLAPARVIPLARRRKDEMGTAGKVRDPGRRSYPKADADGVSMHWPW